MAPGEPFRANLARVDDESRDLADRAERLAVYRAATGRTLSQPTRLELRAAAAELRRTAAALDELAAEPGSTKALIAALRRAGVPL